MSTSEPAPTTTAGTSSAAPPDPGSDPGVAGLRFAKVLVWLVYAYFALAALLLVLVFFLQLFNASTDAEFTRWVYRSGSRVLEPFRGIFPTRDIGEQGSVVDFAVLFAIIVYGILAVATHTLVDWLDTKALQRKQELKEAQQAARRG